MKVPPSAQIYPRWGAKIQRPFRKDNGLFHYQKPGPVTSEIPSKVRISSTTGWRLVRTILGDGFRDMFDTIPHPDLTDGQVPLILKQMDETATDLSQ